MRSGGRIRKAIKALQKERTTMQRTYDFAKLDSKYEGMIYALKWCLGEDDIVIERVIERFQK